MTSAGSAGLGGALDAFLADATVDEYSALGLPAAPGTHREGRRGWSIGVVACLIGLVLAAALMQARADSPARTDQRDALLARIAAADSTVCSRDCTCVQQERTQREIARWPLRWKHACALKTWMT